MELNKTYITMCEKSEVIQQLRPTPSSYQKGDFFYFDVEGKDGKLLPFTSFLPKEYIWVPRVDQLQKLIWGWVDEVVFRLQGELIYYETFNTHGTAETFEEAWLRILMREKHNCFWDAAEAAWENRG